MCLNAVEWILESAMQKDNNLPGPAGQREKQKLDGFNAMQNDEGAWHSQVWRRDSSFLVHCGRDLVVIQ